MLAMFHPLECFIGLRYLQDRARRGFVSFISLASLLGISLGVAALIVILSVMNGFETELRTRLLSMTAHASLSQTGTDFAGRTIQENGFQPKKMDPRKWIEIQENGSTKMNLKEPYRALTKFALLPPSQFWQAPQPGNR